jgi:hypothetical protein
MSAPKSLLSLLLREKEEAFPGKALALKEGGKASLFKIRMGII